MRGFDHFMVHKDIGRNRKLRRRLTPDERWCYLAGVLAIAAQSPIRGRLLIGNESADEQDLADEAGVKVAVARSTLKKLRDLEMLTPDDEFDCERVHDFEEHNPEPKKDRTAAERMRRRRARLRAAGQPAEVPESTRQAVFERDGHRCLGCDATDDLTIDHVVPVVAGGTHDSGNLGTLCGTCNRMKGVTLLFAPNGDVTAGDGHVTVTPPEVEEEEKGKEKDPPTPVTGGDDLGWKEWLEHHCSITGFEPPAERTKAYKAMVALFRQRRQEGYELEQLKLATVGAWNDQHRRENGYHTPDSILRPTKVHGLIEKGKRVGSAAPVLAIVQNSGQRGGGQCRRCHEREIAPNCGPYCNECAEAVA